MSKVISNSGMCSEDNTWRGVIALRGGESGTNCTWWSWEAMKRTSELIPARQGK